MLFTLNRSFSMSVERTPRVLEVAETFGVGVSDRQFTVLKNLEVFINPGDVVYITGQSGSGKSTILREVHREMTAAGWNVADIHSVELDDRPLIDQVGKSMGQASELLSKAGINDAKLMISRPSELSDGQRYRMRLAKLMESQADVWVADEFGAVLDRVTAKVVAFNLQKAARQAKKTVLVATTHTDLVEELAPSLTITKRYGDRVELRAAG